MHNVFSFSISSANSPASIEHHPLPTKEKNEDKGWEIGERTIDITIANKDANVEESDHFSVEGDQFSFQVVKEKQFGISFLGIYLSDSRLHSPYRPYIFYLSYCVVDPRDTDEKKCLYKHTHRVFFSYAKHLTNPFTLNLRWGRIWRCLKTAKKNILKVKYRLKYRVKDKDKSTRPVLGAQTKKTPTTTLLERIFA